MELNDISSSRDITASRLFLAEEDDPEGVVNQWFTWFQEREDMKLLLRGHMYSVTGICDLDDGRQIAYFLAVRLIGKVLCIRLGLLKERDEVLANMPEPEVSDGQHRAWV